MSLYFDNAVKSHYKDVINTHLAWHPQASCLAVAAYTEDKGGTVTVLTGEGKICDDVDIPPHPTAQVTALVWHPYKRILAIGWESGELFIFNDHEHELHEIKSLHRAPISVLHFSLGGKRLVTGDASGSLVGWNADGNGYVQTAFSHELKDPLSQIVFRVSVGVDRLAAAVLDINGLAKAAVSGDEHALDIFSSWRPRTGHKRIGPAPNAKDNPNFYLGSTTGILYHVNETGNCVEVLQAEGGVKKLLHHNSRNLLIVITEGLVLGQFSVDADGSVKEISKVKLSGRSSDIQVTWASAGLLAVTTGDGFIRLWNIDSGENFILDLRESFGYKSQEHIMCLSYCDGKKTMCAGTNMGNIAMWKHEEPLLKEDNYAKDPEKEWKLQSPTVLSGAVSQVAWGSTQNLLAANTVKDVYILNEQDMVTSFKDQVSVVQTSPTNLAVDIFTAESNLELKAEIQVQGVHNSVDHIIIWNKKRIVVYEINTDASSLRVVDSFSCETDAAVIHENNIYSIEGKNIFVRSFGGSIRQTFSMAENEGEPICIDVCGNFLTVSTIRGTIKMWDLSKREAKVHLQGKAMNELIKDFGEIISAKCNCNGTKISIVSAQSSLVPDPKLYIWDIENDTFTYFNFETGQSEDDDGSAPPNSAESHISREITHQDRTKRESAVEVGGRFVMFQSWDAEDPRLIFCEAKSQMKEKKDKMVVGRKLKQEKPSIMLVSIFVSSDRGMVVQEALSLLPDYARFIGIHVPFTYLLNSSDLIKEKNLRPVTQRVMRDFAGLENADQPTREAMLNFSFYLSIGNMDEAFKSIKAIKSETVWENMAKMCVKTKRLDVASLCLGNMGHARGARALRKSMVEPQLDAKVAMLALQLGMIEDAERLYKSCGRHDLLNQLYQAAGNWSKALEISDKEDRIHLRSTHYNYAKHLENKGDFSGAISHYEKSDTYRFEVPRMLFDELPTLEDYIMHTDDKGLRRWWAQYLESTGEMETALQFYEAAGDHLSLVRVYCYCNNLEKAAEIANQADDRAACYHLARQYENVDKVKEAIHFFTRAQAYGNAIRICKENLYDDQLMNLALVAGPQEQIDAARYFTNSERPQISKAVMLYHKAGLISKAVDLAFKSGQVSTVAQIASELDESADPAVIQRCAQYFISISQYDKAANLLITGKQFIEALDLCIEHNVRVTEELAERFTLPKDETTRNEILEKVAECAYAQENYKLATKKFTQAGNKVKAMKCLLKSGDTERIVYFANVCRQPDIYIMAANYLQTLDVRKEPDVMRNIVVFYSRAKANSLLAAFYDSCAQIEIDEYQNYEKAAIALKESYKCLSDTDDPQVEEKKRDIQYKLERVKQFLDLKGLLQTGGEVDEPIRELYDMLDDPKLDEAVRKGDVFASIIEYFTANGNFKSALGTLQEMKNRIPKANPTYFISPEALQAIGRATGVTIGENSRGDPGDGEEEGAALSGDEEIIEEEEEEANFNQMPPRRLVNGSAKFL